MAGKVQEIHGVAGIDRVSRLPHETNHKTRFHIYDGSSEVVVYILNEGAALTPDEARYVARQLEASAARVEAEDGK